MSPRAENTVVRGYVSANISQIGTVGLERVTIQALAKHNASHIYFADRNATAASSLVNESKALYPDVPITFIHVDFRSLAFIKCAAAKLSLGRLNTLLCNGGVMDMAPAVTADGFEIHMGINHIGHAMLTGGIGLDSMGPLPPKEISQLAVGCC